MSQKILVISGKKQSGKSSLRNYLMGVKLVDNGIWKKFNISTNGELMVPTISNGHETMKCLDLNNRDIEFLSYANQVIWPLCKNYSLGNYLKYICIDLFNLTYEQCFGSDEEKNTETNIRWSDIAFLLPPRKVGAIKNQNKIDHFLTARQFMEEFGSNVCRKIYNKCWVEKCKREIINDGFDFNIIDDCRFPDEIESLNEENFEVLSIRLKRSPIDSDSEAENALNDYTNFDLIIEDCSIQEKNEQVLTFLRDRNWL